MKSNPVLPGGSLTSKPTWLNTAGYSVTSAFSVFSGAERHRRHLAKVAELEGREIPS
jgi:exosome complex RNA-binding protein Rrp4